MRSAAIEWTMERITARRAMADRLAAARSLTAFTLVHGSPRDPTWEYVYAASIARANLSRFDTRHCLVGHTHVPLVFRSGSPAPWTARWLRRERLQIELDERRALINPGSVGQPATATGAHRACCSTLNR